MGTWIGRNAIALVALFVALGGIGYAAKEIDGKDIEKRSIAGKKLKKNTLGGKEVEESKLAAVPEAEVAASAGSASTADSAGTANSAANADALGGIPASSFTRPDCGSASGAIKGFVQVDASTAIPATFSAQGITTSYNCSGGSVLVRRVPPSAGDAGGYFVQFSGNPASIGVANHQFLGALSSTEAPGDIRFAVTKRGPETFSVHPSGSGANAALEDFNLVLY